MKKLLPIWLLILSSTIAFSQSQHVGKISGVLTDSTTNAAVPYATVALMEGQKVIKGTTTEETGKFILTDLPTGSFSLTVSFIGYRSLTIPVTLTTQKNNLDLGTVKIPVESKILEAVTVKGEKPLIEDKGDRLVYNAESDISNAGGTAADVLRKVPGVTVDLSGNVQMRGNSNIKVLINGKPSTMMARNLADALRQMPANLIKSVEVINSPGAKYDAEGSGGVINIITKKGLQGFNGSVNATIGNFNSGAGTSLSYKKNKLGISLSVNGYQYRNYFRNNSTRTTYKTTLDSEIDNIMNQSLIYDNTGRGGFGQMSIDYDFDSTSRMNFSADIWGGKYPNNSIQSFTLFDGRENQLDAYRNETEFLNPYGNGQLDLGYTKNFKKPEQEFSILGQYSRMPDNYFYKTTRYSSEDEIHSRQQSTNYSRNKEYTLQTDYVHPFVLNGRKDTTTISIEIGAKGIYRDIGSEYRVKDAVGEAELVESPNLSNDFDYIQKVYSGYTSLRISNKRKWSLNAGLRLEHTDINGDFRTTKTMLNSYYKNLIPSVTLSKGIKSHTIKISYNQRIQRPMIWFLNPWVNESDPKNIWTGNPDLNPELSHASEVGYSLNTEKGTSINSALYFRLVDNAIDFPSTVMDSGIVVTTPKNIATRKAYGLNVNVAGKLNKDWNINGGGDFGFIQLESPLSLVKEKTGTIWTLNFNTTYKLPKGFSIQANGNYFSGWINLMENHSAYYWYGISGKYEFLKEKASLTLNVNSPFSKGVSQKREQSGSNFRTDSNSFFITRTVRLTFEYRFGQMSENSGRKSKKINNDDKSGR